MPIVPAYLAIITGLDVEQLRDANRPLVRIGRDTVLFIAGFSAVLGGLGLSATTIGQGLFRNQSLLTRLSGGLMLAMALFMLGSLFLNAPWLYQERRFHPKLSRFGPFAAPVAGVAFGFGWTPCIGPVLTSILALAASRGDAGQGATLLAVYSAGLGLPFLVTGLAFGRLAGTLGWVKRHVRGRRCCVDGHPCAALRWSRRDRVSDPSCEFVERGSDCQTIPGVGAEFVVAASEVLHERVTTDHDRRVPIPFQTAHRTEPGLESAVVGFDTVVGVLGGVMVHGGQQLDDRASQRWDRSVVIDKHASIRRAHASDPRGITRRADRAAPAHSRSAPDVLRLGVRVRRSVGGRSCSWSWGWWSSANTRLRARPNRRGAPATRPRRRVRGRSSLFPTRRRPRPRRKPAPVGRSEPAPRVRPGGSCSEHADACCAKMRSAGSP
jgi:cytochrome c-type biogenesis protein